MAIINTDEWRAELDRVMAQSSDPMSNKIVDDHGFTVRDFMMYHNLKRTKAFVMICDLVRSGKLTHIGYRSGHGRSKVYEMVKE